MLCHCFTGTETSWNSGCTAFCNREKGIQDTLACDKRNACRETFVCRSWDTDRPFLRKCQISGSAVCELNGYDWFENGVFSVRNRMDNCGFCEIRRHHGFMKDRIGFLGFCDDRTRPYDISFFYCDVCFPLLFCVKGVYTDTSGNIFA